MNWKYYSPTFEFNHNTYSAWWGHTWFAYDLIRNVKPKCIVELGTHYGVSFFSMCQAVKDSKIDCVLHAVDTWEGDPQAKVGYETKDFVFDGLKKEINLNFKSLKIDLHRKKFDEALCEFKDDSIDILHIDGFHSYEAVKYDFETWIPKVKENGIVLFHDICVKKEGFGVHILWNELKIKHKTIEFSHYHGLGVLFKGSNMDYLLPLSNALNDYYGNLSEKNDMCKELKNIKIDKINLEKKVRDLYDENISMKMSKFWKTRSIYLKFKRQLIFIFLHPKKLFKKYLKY